MIKSEGKSRRSKSHQIDNEPKYKHIMLSYSWQNRVELNQLVAKLEPFLYLWRDRSNLTGSEDLWTDIANAIQKSEFVIAIITQDYEKSDSCTNELNFALNKSIPVVPVFLDPNFRPSGNVGLRTSRLFYILFKDIIQSPVLFIKHLIAMSARINNIIDVDNYWAPCLKYHVREIENMILNEPLNRNSNDFNNNRMMNKSNSVIEKLHVKNIDAKSLDTQVAQVQPISSVPPSVTNRLQKQQVVEEENLSPNNPGSYLGLSSDSETSENHYNNSLNVYCMQTSVDGNIVNCTDLKTPYKIGDCMYQANINSKLSKKNNEIINEDPKQESPFNKNLESHAKQSFYIHQSMPDRTQYDFYTREKDELCSFVCHGKQAEIVDADYQDMYDIVTPKNQNISNSLYELIVDLENDSLCSFVHIKDDLFLLATEKARFIMLKPNKSKWDFVRCCLQTKFEGKDAEYYESGLKTLVDMCLDSKGNLIVLNRWNFRKDSSKKSPTPPNDNELFSYITDDLSKINHNEYSYKYSIEQIDFDRSNYTIRYNRTIFCFPDQKPSSQNIASYINSKNGINNEAVNTDKPETHQSRLKIFTRVYNDEKNNCVILIDQLNNKIYWFRKTNGSKIRCLKSVDSTLKQPTSIAQIDDSKIGQDIIFISTSTGLIASNKMFTIKHDILKRLTDIKFDQYEKCLIFIDKNNVYASRIVSKTEDDTLMIKRVESKEKNLSVNSPINNEKNKPTLVPGQAINENDQSNYPNLDLRYKCLFENALNDGRHFRRVISTKNYIFILCASDDLRVKTTIYAVDKARITI